MKDKQPATGGRESAERGKAGCRKKWSANERTSAAVASLYSNFESTPQASAFCLAYRDANGRSRVEIFRRSGRPQIFYALSACRCGRADRQNYLPAARLQGQARIPGRSYSGKNRIIPGWRITSFTPTTLPPLAGKGPLIARAAFTLLDNRA